MYFAVTNSMATGTEQVKETIESSVVTFLDEDNLVTKDGNQVKVMGTAHKIKAIEFEGEGDMDRSRRLNGLHQICSGTATRRLDQEEEGSAATPQQSLGCFDTESVNVMKDSPGGTIEIQTSTGFQTLTVHSWSEDPSSGSIYVNEGRDDEFTLHPSSDCQASSSVGDDGESGRSLVTQAFNLCMKGGALNRLLQCVDGDDNGIDPSFDNLDPRISQAYDLCQKGVTLNHFYECLSARNVRINDSSFSHDFLEMCKGNGNFVRYWEKIFECLDGKLGSYPLYPGPSVWSGYESLCRDYPPYLVTSDLGCPPSVWP